jgi:hypothetical protein
MRRAMVATIILAACFISSCNNADLNLCKTVALENVRDPEAARLQEFKKVSFEDFRDATIDMASRGMDPMVAEAMRSSPLGKEITDRLRDGEHYRMRLQSETYLGEKVTSILMCRVVSGSCECTEVG